MRQLSMWIDRGKHAFWNGRDTRGHYDNADTVAGDYPDRPICHHACCNGKRPHPAGLPVMKKRKKPAAKKKKPSGWESTYTPRRATMTTAQRRTADAAAARESYRLYLHGAYLQAENATHGYMVNAAGKKRGYGGADFFKPGRRPSVTRYGSPELVEYLHRRKVLTATQFRAQSNRHRAA